uniref:PSP proline-rich domain-containing protein n=1 Tax=Emiliania huxleyi TaxID=2903 RepID=A0A6V2VM48_EMIHU
MPPNGGLTAAALAAAQAESDSEMSTIGGASGTDTETESIASSRNSERNRKKKDRKKANRKALQAQRIAMMAGGASSDAAAGSGDAAAEGGAGSAASELLAGMQVEYVPQAPEAELFGTEELSEMAEVFARFRPQAEAEKEESEEERAKREAKEKEEAAAAEEEEGGGEAANEVGKKAKRRLKRLSIAELKQLVSKPEVIEPWDVTSADPRLLVNLKSLRNTVPVPRHWSQKRKFLQGKRGVEKPPFALPEFIAATGIEKIRASVMEKENAKKLKGKMKERVQPKMGKIDIDYQVLHDAFFKFQSKPRLSRFGDTYYEGKEHEVQLRQKKPGVASDELQKALGMELGGPPPWLINMQRYGPPPSYPNLKIAGLNAPIPEGATYGYHPGGWGKPPVDEFGRPLYGDVFGTAGAEPAEQLAPSLSRDNWGAVEEDAEGSDDEEEEDEEEGGGGGDGDTASELSADEVAAGISSVASNSSLPSGLATPDSLHLRKQLGAQRAGTATPSSVTDGAQTPESVSSAQLYQVLQQRDAKVGGAAFGSSHTYDLSGAAPPPSSSGGGASGAPPRPGSSGVALALDPSELGSLDEAALKERYEAAKAAEKEATAPEDVSDIIEEHERKRARKQEGRGRR